MVSDFLFGISQRDVIYDIETYPNVFTFAAQTPDGRRWFFERSDERNDLDALCKFMDTMAHHKCRMVGFNNIGFDYPVIHFIYQMRFLSAAEIYAKAMAIINAPDNARFAHMVWESDHVVEQVDLFKIHHFDNMAKSTSLKILEFNMRSLNVEDLPFDVGIHLDSEQIEVLRSYNWNDVIETLNFYQHSQSEITMRENLSDSLDMNMINRSDVKIGEMILIQEMEKHGIQCYDQSSGGRRMRQTHRSELVLKDCLLPYIKFERPEFQRILDYVKAQTIVETKGVFKGLIATVEGVDYVFGTGGLHASVESCVISSSDTHQIVDVDVASYYPNLAIKNKLFPAHLGVEFCDVYEGLYKTRRTYPKGTSENEAYKLALNGAYGNSNSKYSPLYDPLFTMTITLGGQFSLCMLIEQLVKVPGLSMIQANTDGVTFLCPHEYVDHTRQLCRWWEQVTQLELEEALYSRMFIRDVNNYMAEKMDGKVKRIGAYASETSLDRPGTRELPWHKNWSSRVVPLAAEAALVHGTDIREFITKHHDYFDFMLRTKVPRSSRLEHGGERVANTVRYYVSTDGAPLEKVMPPKGELGTYKRKNGISDAEYYSILETLADDEHDERIHTKNKSKHEIRRTAIHTGWIVTVCNKLPRILEPDYIDNNGNDGGDVQDYIDWGSNINFDWYVREAEKLVNPLVK